MTMITFTGSTDFVGKPKRLSSWHLSQAAGTQTVNFRNGGAAGPIILQAQLPANASSSQAYGVPAPFFPNSLYLEVVGTSFVRGAVDLV
jgi:hypothetical protein